MVVIGLLGLAPVAVLLVAAVAAWLVRGVTGHWPDQSWLDPWKL